MGVRLPIEILLRKMTEAASPAFPLNFQLVASPSIVLYSAEAQRLEVLANITSIRSARVSHGDGSLGVSLSAALPFDAARQSHARL